MKTNLDNIVDLIIAEQKYIQGEDLAIAKARNGMEERAVLLFGPVLAAYEEVKNIPILGIYRRAGSVGEGGGMRGEIQKVSDLLVSLPGNKSMLFLQAPLTHRSASLKILVRERVNEPGQVELQIERVNAPPEWVGGSSSAIMALANFLAPLVEPLAVITEADKVRPQ